MIRLKPSFFTSGLFLKFSISLPPFSKCCRIHNDTLRFFVKRSPCLFPYIPFRPRKAPNTFFRQVDHFLVTIALLYGDSERKRMGYLLMKGEYFTFHGIFYTLNKKFAQKSPAFAGLSHLLIQERKEEFLVFIRVHIFFCDKLRSGIHHFRKGSPPEGEAPYFPHQGIPC